MIYVGVEIEDRLVDNLLAAAPDVLAYANAGGGLVVDRGVPPAARRPVDRVLQRAGDRVVVLGSGDEQRVGVGNAAAEVRDRRLSRAAANEILAEYREALEGYTYLDFDA